MAAKIIALVLTILINIVIGVAMFFFMLVAMNGFNGSDAEKGLIVYIALAVVVTILMGTGAFFATRFFIKKGLKGAFAVLITVPIFSVVGGVAKFICSFIGIAVAEYVRVNY